MDIMEPIVAEEPLPGLGEDPTVRQQIHLASEEPRMTPSTDLSMVKAVSPFNEADTRAILRQIEFYFSDQNLRSDSHLLGLANGDGNGPVSINEICGFKKMRAYKPRAAVKEILKQSAVLDVNGKKVKRRFPLAVKLFVKPKIDIERERKEKTLAANPHLTKNMVKPTGFEEGYTNYPITPAEHERNLKLYDPEISLWVRIENALSHYCSKRKMHQKTKHVFDLWTYFGGIANGPAAFIGGQNDVENEDLDKDDIAGMHHQYSVDDLVLQDDENWTVDFEAVALGFLSTEFLSWCEWDIAEQVDNVCNVMVNFFTFLLHHNVCPEYVDQLVSAKQAVTKAGVELKILHKADKAMRHERCFDAACKLLSGGHEAMDNTWDTAVSTEPRQLTLEEARSVFYAAVAAFDLPLGPEGHSLRDSDTVTETLPLEIVSITPPNEAQAGLFAHLKDTVVPNMGTIECRRWTRTYEPQYDLPHAKPVRENYLLVVHEKALHTCLIGMKLDAQIKTTTAGICWIDELYNLHPSFYTWLPNNMLAEIKQRLKEQDTMLDLLKPGGGWRLNEEGRYCIGSGVSATEQMSDDISETSSNA